MNARLVVLSLVLCLANFAPATPLILSRIPREAITSTAIRTIGYSKRRHILEIEFVNGAVYRYLQITPSIHRELMSADSKTRYYDRHIKGNYPSLRVRSRGKP